MWTTIATQSLAKIPFSFPFFSMGFFSLVNIVCGTINAALVVCCWACFLCSKMKFILFFLEQWKNAFTHQNEPGSLRGFFLLLLNRRKTKVEPEPIYILEKNYFNSFPSRTISIQLALSKKRIHLDFGKKNWNVYFDFSLVKNSFEKNHLKKEKNKKIFRWFNSTLNRPGLVQYYRLVLELLHNFFPCFSFSKCLYWFQIFFSIVIINERMQWKRKIFEIF